MTNLSITIDDETARTIEELAARLGRPKEELAASLLDQQVALVKGSTPAKMSLDKFEEICSRLRPYAEAAGYTSEQQILDDIS